MILDEFREVIEGLRNIIHKYKKMFAVASLLMFINYILQQLKLQQQQSIPEMYLLIILSLVTWIFSDPLGFSVFLTELTHQLGEILNEK